MLIESAKTFYESLEENDQYLLKAAALLATSIGSDNLIPLVINKYRIAPVYVDKILQKALEHQLLMKDRWGRYATTVDFMVYVYPALGDLTAMFERVKRSQFPSYSDTYSFRNCLFTLIYGTMEQYKSAEEAILLNVNLRKPYAKILSHPDYAPFIARIDSRILMHYMTTEVSTRLAQLAPTSLFEESFSAIDNHPNIDTSFYLAGIPALLRGDFTEAKIEASLANDLRHLWVLAMEKVAQGKMEEAFVFFEKGLKRQRREAKGTYMPLNAYASLYYLIVLIALPLEKSFPLFLQIVSSHAKGAYPFLISMYIPAIHAMLKDDKAMHEQLLKNEYAYRHELINETVLASIPVFYLCDVQPKKEYLPLFLRVIDHARVAGYLTAAYEAAYALWQLTGDNDIESLYNKIAAKMHFTPALSRLKKLDSWEKSLQILLELSANKKKNGEGKTQSPGRIVYLFNPTHCTIQPVLQKLTAKGWSAGRPIALKKLALNQADFMTDHDRRIASHLYHDRSYHQETYQFLNSVFIELVGHPHVFLVETENVPVSFFAARPQIHIEKKNGHYSLVCDIKQPLNYESVILQKETNTQYRVIELNTTQKKIIQFLNETVIKIPEEGEALLTELSANLSAGELEVHTTLKLSGKEHAPIKNVPADNRIRIQLLPFGDGLKAELYSKPFGDSAPYCKPGKGGKILLRNKEEQQEQVHRNFAKEQEHERLLMEDIQSLESIELNDGLISFGDPLDSLYLLDAIDRHKDISVVEWPEGIRLKLLGKAGTKSLSLNVKSGIDWFDLDGELKVNEKKVLSLQQLMTLSQQSHGRFIELSPGEYLALSDQLKKHLNDLSLFGTTTKKGVKINHLASLALDGLFHETDQLKSDPAWKKFQKKVEEGEAMELPIPANLQAELRPYQEEGFRWMARLASWGAGACLADDMGLGKTIQTLTVLLHRATSGPALVVCPVSVMGNWENEIHRFAPSLSVKRLNTTHREETINTLKAGEVLITSYGLLLTESERLSQVDFATVALDEAHMIKNYSTKTSKAAMSLKAAFRIVLTGTPVQNHLGEIWNLFNFINPGLLGTLSHFQQSFIKNNHENSQRRLRKLIAPFILRRTKTKVLDELPPKTEIIRKITLSEDEMAYYEILRRQALESLEEDSEAGHIQVLAAITRLRQACCNPRLVDPKIKLPSSKMNTFLDIVDELMENNHRALVFSQFVAHLTLVRQELDKRKIHYQYLDGSTPQPERIRQVAAFQEGIAPLFLISLKAGGLGLNLTTADYVIHLDPWWNPAIEDQASDRTHRIGQQRPVTVYRLVTEQTIEEKIIRLHHTKRDMAETLLEGSDQSAKFSARELIELMREQNL